MGAPNRARTRPVGRGGRLIVARAACAGAAEAPHRAGPVERTLLMQGHPIVVYADDQRILRELPEQLRLDGYEPHAAQARRQFMWALAERRPAAVLLGDLPTLAPTLALLRELRAHEPGAQEGVDPDVPALVLTAAGGELCELRAFEAGADDFQPASISYLVLRARLGALIARSQITRRGGRVAVGSLRIDTSRLEASYAGRALRLSKLEFAAPARPRAPARLHEGRAAAAGVGLPRRGQRQHPHARRARLKAAAQARRSRRRGRDREPPRCRLPARPA